MAHRAAGLTVAAPFDVPAIRSVATRRRTRVLGQSVSRNQKGGRYAASFREEGMEGFQALKRLRSATASALFGAVAIASLAAGDVALAQSKGLIVVFMPPGTDNYLAQWQVGAKTKAKDLGYDIKIIESSRDQAEQDSQVDQELASGEDVAGFIWWPYVNAAGTGSLRKLSETGKPVIFTNQYPIEGTEKFWTAYAGVDDFLNGRPPRRCCSTPAPPARR
jgi:hypothetical protein